MPTISATPTPTERLELRDGIFFYRKLSRRGGALVLAAPKQCVEVVHRAEHRRLRRVSDQTAMAAVFVALFQIPIIVSAVFHSDPFSILAAAGLGLILTVFFTTNVIRWPLRNDLCSTEIAVSRERTKYRLLFTRVQGEDYEFEALLDRLQRRESVIEKEAPSACVVELAKSRRSYLQYGGYAVGALLLGMGALVDQSGPALPGYVWLAAAVVIVVGIMLAGAINGVRSSVMRVARGALLDGDLDSAVLVLRQVLEGRPYHAYGNYLMTAHALATGDLDAAAQHRAAMNGPASRERLSVIAIDFAHTISSEPAFRKLADYAHGKGEVGADALSRVSP